MTPLSLGAAAASAPPATGTPARTGAGNDRQAGGFDALLEFQDHKPFECVGEGRESRAAMATLAARPEWKEDVLVKRFASLIQPTLAVDELQIEPLLVFDGEHRIPAALWERLRANFAA